MSIKVFLNEAKVSGSGKHGIKRLFFLRMERIYVGDPGGIKGKKPEWREKIIQERSNKAGRS